MSGKITERPDARSQVVIVEVNAEDGDGDEDDDAREEKDVAAGKGDGGEEEADSMGDDDVDHGGPTAAERKAGHRLTRSFGVCLQIMYKYWAKFHSN